MIGNPTTKALGLIKLPNSNFVCVIPNIYDASNPKFKLKNDQMNQKVS